MCDFFVLIIQVLKNKEKREIYDNVLSQGLPAAYLYVPRYFLLFLCFLDFTFVSLIYFDF